MTPPPAQSSTSQAATAQPGAAQPGSAQPAASQPGPPQGNLARPAMPPPAPLQPQPLSPPTTGPAPGQPAVPSPQFQPQQPAAPAQPQPTQTASQPTTQPPPGQRPPADAGRPEGQGSANRGSGHPAPPDAPPGSVPADQPDAPLIQGTVAGATPQGRPILATTFGMLALAVPASLPQGTRVTAALTSAADALTTAAPPAGLPGPLTERDWPAMRQLVAALAGLDRALAQSVLAAIPQPNRKLGAAASFFLAAIRGGDARGWLGEEAAGALDRAGRGDLLAQLERDFRTLQQQAAEPLPGDWRLYTLPMFDGQGLRPVQVHIHPLHDGEEARGRESDKPGSRFLIDVDLSRLGPLQLDGLVRPNQFDLILRSHAALPGELKVELIQIFADSVRAVGYTGGLSFQSGAKSWVKLTRAGRSGLGVNA
ncbi:hypothetical protein [Azospirillum thermophilum]|uniref:hypothetical protein n=1 Tax=Azospirillum thermophilum TaxID=2202148 RepID=UPI001FEAA4EA|nr:hypothetical protein [Azospirillum thermophilum]